MSGKRFIKSTFIYTIGGSLPLIAGAVLAFYYTSFLDKVSYGELAIFTAFTLLMQVVVNLGFDAALGIYYFQYKDEPEKLKRLLSSVTNLLFILGVAIVVLSFFFGESFFSILYSNDISFFPYGVVAIITAILNNFFRTYTNLAINRQEALRFFYFNFSYFTLLLALSIIGIQMFPYTLIGPMYGKLIATGIMFFVAFYFFYKEFGFYLNKELLRQTLPVALSLLAYAVLSWITNYIDRNIILFFSDSSDVGIYDFALRCVIVIDVLQVALTNAINPRVFSIWKDEQITGSTTKVNRYFNVFTAITIVIIALNIYLLPYILPLVVTNKSFYDIFKYIPFLALSFAFRGIYSMILAPIFYFKKTHLLTKILLIVTVFQLIISVLLIKYFDLFGAAAALIISKIFTLFIMKREVQTFFKFSYNTYKLFWLPLFYTIMIIGSELIGGINKDWIRIIQLLSTFLLLGLVFRKELKVMVVKRSIFP